MASRSKKRRQRRKAEAASSEFSWIKLLHEAIPNWSDPDPNDPKWIDVLDKASEAFSSFDEISKRRLLSSMRGKMLSSSLDDNGRKWVENASYPQLLVAFYEGLVSNGTDPKSFADDLYETTSGYDGYSHYVDVIGVHFDGSANPDPMFPVFEIICAYGVPEIPTHLVVDITSSSAPPGLQAEEEELVDVVFRDPTLPVGSRPLYIGHMGLSAALMKFDRYRRIWGHFFLRLSFDEKRVAQLSRGERPHTSESFHPPSGVYYRDYIVFDNNAKRPLERQSSPAIYLPQGAHTFIENLTRDASTMGPRKFTDHWLKYKAIFENPHEHDKTGAKEVFKYFFYKPMVKISGRKLPWKLKEEFSFRSKNKNLMLKHLFRITDDMRDKYISAEDEEERTYYKKIYTALRKARTYEFTPTAYYRVFQECEEYVLKDVIGMDYSSSEEFHLQFGASDAQMVMEMVSAEANNVPFPEHLPFECCYFGWGPGVPADTYTRISFKAMAKEVGAPFDAAGMTLLGHLVMESGEVVSFFDIHDDRIESVEIAISTDRQGELDQWATGSGLVPWMVVTVSGDILSHAVVEEQDYSSSERRKYERRGKKDGVKKPIPPPYYTVYVRDKMIKRRIRKASTGVGRKQSYRHDVEGHPRLLYQIGKLPISDKKRRDFEKRGYTIYPHGTPIPADLQVMMMEREKDMPKRGQWVALRKIFVKPFISPSNPDLPYVPATRKTTKGITSQNYKEEDDDE